MKSVGCLISSFKIQLCYLKSFEADFEIVLNANKAFLFFYRRYVILIKSHLITYKDNMNRDAPTEIIPINNCCTVKSADDELNQKNSFKVLVNDRTFYFIGADNSDKESWIGALGKAMIKSSVLIDDNLDGAYM